MVQQTISSSECRELGRAAGNLIVGLIFEKMADRELVLVLSIHAHGDPSVLQKARGHFGGARQRPKTLASNDPTSGSGAP